MADDLHYETTAKVSAERITYVGGVMTSYGFTPHYDSHHITKSLEAVEAVEAALWLKIGVSIFVAAFIKEAGKDAWLLLKRFFSDVSKTDDKGHHCAIIIEDEETHLRITIRPDDLQNDEAMKSLIEIEITKYKLGPIYYIDGEWNTFME